MLLENGAAGRRYALDETPVNPDSPMLKAYRSANGVPLSTGHASIWTLFLLYVVMEQQTRVFLYNDENRFQWMHLSLHRPATCVLRPQKMNINQNNLG